MENRTDPVEQYKVVRGQIEHVDNNLSQRVIWLVIAQSFFFSGYAILINGKPAKPELDTLHAAMVNIFPIAALLTVVFTCIDVYYSINYMRHLRKNYEKSDIKQQPANFEFPPILGIKKNRVMMHASPVLIPIMFIVTWVIIIIIQHR